MSVSRRKELFNQYLTYSTFRDGLRPNGVIIIKENITSTNDTELDRQDSSVTRPMSLFRQIFDKANLECYRQVKQRNFPKGLYSVYMFVLKARTDKCPDGECINKDEVPLSNKGFDSAENSCVNKNVQQESQGSVCS